MSSALDRQEGGTHYRQGKIQPIQFIVANNWDFPLGSSLKYLTRCPFKGTPFLDLQKAQHYVELREELTQRPPIVQRAITMDEFVQAQGIQAGSDHAAAMLALEMYALGPRTETRSLLFGFIEKLKTGLTTP